jgi:hypothetical protein
MHDYHKDTLLNASSRILTSLVFLPKTHQPCLLLQTCRCTLTSSEDEETGNIVTRGLVTIRRDIFASACKINCDTVTVWLGC